MKFAIIENNLVTNIIVAEQNFIDVNFPNAVNVDLIKCGIGWTYDGENFVAPVIEETDGETL